MPGKENDADAIRDDSASRKIQALTPGLSKRRTKIENDWPRYRERNQIVRFCGQLKIYRAIKSPYGPLAESFVGIGHISAARYWLKFVSAA